MSRILPYPSTPGNRLLPVFDLSHVSRAIAAAIEPHMAAVQTSALGQLALPVLDWSSVLPSIDLTEAFADASNISTITARPVEVLKSAFPAQQALLMQAKGERLFTPHVNSAIVRINLRLSEVVHPLYNMPFTEALDTPLEWDLHEWLPPDSRWGLLLRIWRRDDNWESALDELAQQPEFLRHLVSPSSGNKILSPETRYIETQRREIAWRLASCALLEALEGIPDKIPLNQVWPYLIEKTRQGIEKNRPLLASGGKRISQVGRPRLFSNPTDFVNKLRPAVERLHRGDFVVTAEQFALAWLGIDAKTLRTYLSTLGWSWDQIRRPSFPDFLRDYTAPPEWP